MLYEPGLEVIKTLQSNSDYMGKIQFCCCACQKLAKLTEDVGRQGEVKREGDWGKLMVHQGKSQDS